MKKIFLFIFIIISIKSFSQDFPNYNYQSSPLTRHAFLGSLQAKKGFINGVYIDTTAANADYINFHNGAQIWTSSDGNFWLFDSVFNTWIRMAKYNEVSSIYTASLPLRKTSFDFSADTSVSYSPSLTTNERLQKLVDSLNAAGWAIPTLQQVTDAGRTTTNKIYANGGLTVPQSQNIDFNINDADQFLNNGWGGRIAQDNSSGKMYLNPTVSSGTAGGSPSYSTPAIMFRPDGRAELNTGNSQADSLDVVVIDTVTGILYRKRLSSGSGTNNVNVGSGYRLYQPSTEGIKTLFNGYAVRIDSSSNTDGLTLKADTALLTTTASRQKLIDSLFSILNIEANPKDRYQYSYDMSGETIANYHLVASGTGSSLTNMGATWTGGNYYSVKKMSLGTTTTGTVYGHYNSSLIYFPMTSTIRYNLGVKIRFEDLSDGTETYKFWVGYYDDHFTPPASLLDGIYFTYTHSDSSGTFLCHTMSNGTETIANSGITVAADTDYFLQISSYNGEAKFYINNTLVSTITTNLPSGTSRTVSIEMTYKKSAGTTNRDAYLGQFSYGTLDY